MKIRSGIDMVRIDRLENIIAKDKKSFIDRVLTPDEQRYVFEATSSDKRAAERFASRFAAKEAAAKAIGTGLMTDGIGFTDFEVTVDEFGAPGMRLHGKALERVNTLGMLSISISLTHEGDYAAAVCSILTDEEDK